MAKRVKPQRLVAYVKPSVKVAVERIAVKLGVSASVIVNLALAEYLKAGGS